MYCENWQYLSWERNKEIKFMENFKDKGNVKTVTKNENKTSVLQLNGLTIGGAGRIRLPAAS